jgi:hypothetical protein
MRELEQLPLKRHVTASNPLQACVINRRRIGIEIVVAVRTESLESRKSGTHIVIKDNFVVVHERDRDSGPGGLVGAETMGKYQGSGGAGVAGDGDGDGAIVFFSRSSASIDTIALGHHGKDTHIASW